MTSSQIEVLCVDDEPEILNLTKIFLERAGHLIVTTVGSASEALKTLEGRHYDAIISDYDMPEMNGLELLKIIRIRFPELPFIIFTGKSREQVVITALNEGANHYLHKSAGDPNSQFAELEHKVKSAVYAVRAKKAAFEAERREAIEKERGQFLDGLTAATSMGKNPKDNLKRMMKEVVKFYEADGAWVANIKDRKKRGMTIFVSQGIQNPDFLKMVVPWGEGAGGLAIKTGQGIIIYDYASDSRLAHVDEIDRLVEKEGIKSALVVPMGDNRAFYVFWRNHIMLSQEKLDTLRKLANLALIDMVREEEIQRYKEFINFLPQVVFETDENRRITLINHPALRIIGYQADDITEKTDALDLLDGEEKESARANFEKMIKGEMPFCRSRYNIKRKDGSTFPAMVYTSPIDNGQGIRGVVADLTEQIATERNVFEVYRVLKIILESLPYLAFVRDENMRNVMMNEAYCKALNKSEDELRGLDDFDLLPKKIAQQYYDSDMEAVRTNQVMVSEDVVDNQTFKTTKVPINLFGKSWLAVIVENITAQKRFDESLKEMINKIGLMASITRHDIRNQLVVVNGYFGLLMDEMEKKGSACDKSKDMSKKILNALKIIERQIEFTKTYQEIGINNPGWNNFKKIIRACHGYYPNINFKCDVEGLEIFADPLFGQVAHNLVDNTNRHGNVNGEIVIRISQELLDNGDMKVIFEDNGEGVPDSEKELIFERGHGKNTGLGLFLVREILKITGITIKETGQYGKGARFEMVIPNHKFRVQST